MDNQLLPIQRRIYQELLRIDERASRSYKSALKVLEDFDNPDRLSQSAHSLREVTALIIRKVSLPQEVKEYCESCGNEIEKKESHKKKLEKRFVENVEMLPLPAGKETEALLKEWIILYKKFLAICHHKDGEEISEKEFKGLLSQFEALLFRFLEPMPTSIKELDSLLGVISPTDDDIYKLLNLLNHPIKVQYFFSKLDSPEWLFPLEKKGFFKQPPEYVKEEEYIFAPLWPLSKYLIKISEKSPQEVMNIILNIQNTNNFKVHTDLIDCAIKMPSSIAKKIVPNAKKWIKISRSSLITTKIGDLVIKLSKENELGSSLDLFESLLDIKDAYKGISIKEAQPYCRIWDYQKILETQLPFLLEKEPLKIVEILAKKLNTAIYLEKKANNDESTNFDYSDSWRPSIEDHEQNWRHEDVKETLVVSLRDSLENIGKKDINLLKEALKIIENNKYPIFTRLILDIYTKFPIPFENEVETSIKKYFGNNQVIHEYQILISEQLCKLDKDLIKWYLTKVKEGPSESDDAEYIKHWQLRRLQPIKECLNKVSKKKFEQLVDQYGELDYPDFLTTHKSLYGPISPASTLELEKIFNEKGIEEIVNYLTVWKPSEDPFGEPSAEGLGRELRELVKKYPEEFSKEILKFDNSKIRPTYVLYIFLGLQESLKENKSLEWDNIINFAKKIVFSDNLPSFRSPDYESDWNSVNRFLLNLINEGFNSSYPIPFYRRTDIWKIIERLSSDDELNSEYEDKYLGKDLLSISINTVRGLAIHNVIDYANWCSKNIEEQILVKEVKKILEDNLNPEIEPTKTIRFIYGFKLPILAHLESEWVKDNLYQIFSNDRKLWRAAWEGYIKYSKLYANVFEILLEQYKKVINQLKSPKISRGAKEKLSEHLMQAYIHDLIELENGSLIKLFFENADPEIKGHAMWFIATGLEYLQKNEMNEKKRDHIIKRIMDLWEYRIEDAKKSGGRKKENYIEEFKWFGMWFTYFDFNKSWAISQLCNVLKFNDGNINNGYQILNKLQEYIDIYYLDVLKALILFIKSERWINIEKIGKILDEIISNHPKEEIKDYVNELVDNLIKKGYYDFSKFFIE